MTTARIAPRPARPGPALLSPTLLSPTLLSLALLGLALLGPAPALADRLDDVHRRGEILAGVKDTVKPFGFRDSKGKIQGFEPDLVRAVARRMGVRVRLEPVDSATRMAGLLSGRLDMVAAGMAHTLSRDEVIDFSVAYFMDGVRLLTAADSGIKDADALAGRRVGIVSGDTAGTIMAHARPRCLIIPMESFSQAFLALKQGRVDALAADATILLFLKNADSEPRRWDITDQSFSSRPVAMGLPENESGLRDAVNRALLELWQSGDFRLIFDKWFGPKTPYHLPLDWRMEIWPK